MLFLSQTLLGESNLVAEFLQLMRVLLGFTASLVFITLFKLFEFCLLFISDLGQPLSRLVKLVS